MCSRLGQFQSYSQTSAYLLDKTLNFVLKTEPLELDSDELVGAHDWLNISLLTQIYENQLSCKNM